MTCNLLLATCRLFSIEITLQQNTRRNIIDEGGRADAMAGVAEREACLGGGAAFIELDNRNLLVDFSAEFLRESACILGLSCGVLVTIEMTRNTDKNVGDSFFGDDASDSFDSLDRWYDATGHSDAHLGEREPYFFRPKIDRKKTLGVHIISQLRLPLPSYECTYRPRE
jgi:hypothetical protein